MSSSVISSAKISSIPGSVRKINATLKTIRGVKVDDALDMLSVSRKRIAYDLIKLIKSAVANAKQKGHSGQSMSIGTVDIGKSFTLRRYAFGGRGRTGVVNQHYSFIRIFLVV